MSEKSDDFLSFEKALRELKMRSEELKKLVSEGEIRAFRDGDSMKFRREDISALSSKEEGDSNLSFADSLEDDTGMVTEQISEEDTLIADDEEDVVETRTTRRTTTAVARPSRAAAAAGADSGKEPGWVTAVAILAGLLMLWGFMISYSVSQESDPAGNLLTSVFAAEK